MVVQFKQTDGNSKCCLFYRTADSVCYFGILFATPQLHGNQFLNIGISGIVEIPALIICMFIINR